MTQQRRTKIVVTLGPATDNPAALSRVIEAGADVVRLNFSHGDQEAHRKRVLSVREQAAQLNRTIGILADLQGPKVRIARFRNKEGIQLTEGDEFVLDADLPSHEGTQTAVGLDYRQLPEEVAPGALLLIDDGQLRLKVKTVQGKKIICDVVEGGMLTDNKGINLYGGGLSAEVITQKDKADIQTAVALGVDYIALSFTSRAEDIHQARALMGKAGRHIGIIAKIERAEALERLDEIIKASNGVMVARGDLGVEIGEAQVPGVQKNIIARARHGNRLVIVATQMMETMILKRRPTRAEVSDVANAVLDGSDAVMLSAETAVGKYPDLVVRAMADICLEAEKHPSMHTSKHRVDHRFSRVDEVIAMATMYTANHMKIKAIVALTESGATPLWMSRIDSGIPIYALSRHTLTRGKMALFRGVYPIAFDVTQIDRANINQAAIDKLRENTTLNKGDCVILTKGDEMGALGGTNTMKVIEI